MLCTRVQRFVVDLRIAGILGRLRRGEGSRNPPRARELGPGGGQIERRRRLDGLLTRVVVVELPAPVLDELGVFASGALALLAVLLLGGASGLHECAGLGAALGKLEFLGRLGSSSGRATRLGRLVRRVEHVLDEQRRRRRRGRSTGSSRCSSFSTGFGLRRCHHMLCFDRASRKVWSGGRFPCQARDRCGTRRRGVSVLLAEKRIFGRRSLRHWPRRERFAGLHQALSPGLGGCERSRPTGRWQRIDLDVLGRVRQSLS
jgi:hypothetical protein